MDSEALKKNFLDYFVKTFGNISGSCKATGIVRQTYYNWRETDPEFKAAIDALDPREDFKDFVENKLIQKIKQGDTAVTIFVAKTQLKDRGYIERTEHTIRTDEPIEVELRIDKRDE